MNKKQRMNEEILNHGLKLKKIFDLQEIGPVTLCKKLHRLEGKAHRMATDYCNGLIETEDYMEKKEKSTLKSLDKILGFTIKGIPCIINSDPRGYALKIDDEYVRNHNLDIYKDWGGYGILAPEFNGSR